MRAVEFHVSYRPHTPRSSWTLPAAPDLTLPPVESPGTTIDGDRARHSPAPAAHSPAYSDRRSRFYRRRRSPAHFQLQR